MKQISRRKIRWLALCCAALLALLLCGCAGQEQQTNQAPIPAQNVQSAEETAQPEQGAAEKAAAQEPEDQKPEEPEKPDAQDAPQETAPSAQENQPEQAQDTAADGKLTCTISISCETLLSRLDDLDPEKVELVPEDGWILAPVTVEFTEGQSVFDVLLDTVKANAIHMEYQNTPMYQSAYIEGIGNLYEFDCGALSGWMYCVNGWFPNYGCSRYTVEPGDVIEWMYTCELGSDIGGEGARQS